MVKPVLKSWDCSDIPEVNKWTPEDDVVAYWLTLSIGTTSGAGADLYQVLVATPAGLKSPLGRQGRKHSRLIVLNQYSWEGVLAAVAKTLDECSGASLAEVQDRLREAYLWEYDGVGERLFRDVSPPVRKPQQAFDSALSSLSPVLLQLGFAPVEEHYHHVAFGSAYAVFARRGEEVRLVWDGKEHALHAERREVGATAWMDIEAPSSTPLPFDPDYSAGRVGALRHAIERTFGGRRVGG